MPPGEDARPALVVPDRPTKRRQEWRSSRRARPRAREDYATADRPPFGKMTRSEIRGYLNAQPYSLSDWWWLHTASARWFETRALRWPRYAWGAVHIVIVALIYLLVWMTMTVPRALILAGLIALAVWWPF